MANVIGYNSYVPMLDRALGKPGEPKKVKTEL